MDVRPTDEIKASFEKIAAVLDEAVRIALATAQVGAVQLLDHSNRSGFDKSGWPYFRYDVELEARRGEGPISRVSVRLSFLEPIESEAAREVQVLTLAERFYAGCSVSISKESTSHTWRAPELPGPADIASTVVEMITAAARVAVSSPR